MYEIHCLYWVKYFTKMQVSISELLNQVEFVPVSLSDPFKDINIDPSTMELLQFLPIIGFIALLMAAIWRQSKKFQVKAFGESKELSK